MEPTRNAEALFRDWAPFVARILLRTGIPRADLEDAVQEVFLVAHRRGGFSAGTASEKTWLAEIALRIASNYRRSRRRKPTHHDELALGNLESKSNDPCASAEARESLERVAQALQTLNEEARLVFVLIEIEGASADEVARGRGVPLGTIYSRLHSARKAFQAAYDQHRGLAFARPTGVLVPLASLGEQELAARRGAKSAPPSRPPLSRFQSILNLMGRGLREPPQVALAKKVMP
ncbi:MAG: sigma-70 family RNA polymerase sigma factor [Polyangiaceae bacterium]